MFPFFKHKKTIRLALLFSLIVGLFFTYLWIYPNDFFLSDKLFRSSEDYQVEKSFFAYKIYLRSEKSADLEDLIENIDTELQKEIGWYKNNAKRTVSIVQKGSSRFFVKRYNSKHFLDYCSKCPFRSSKAFRAFYYAYLFKEQQLPTPEPIALIEKRVGFLWTKCYLISKIVEGHSLEEIEGLPLSSHQRASILSQLHFFMEKLYKNKWVHRDLTLRNLLLSKDQLFFLDLDDLHAYSFKNYFFRKKFFAKHQARLNTSLKCAENFQEVAFFDPSKGHQSLK